MGLLQSLRAAPAVRASRAFLVAGLALAVLSTFMTARPAAAVPIQWTLQNVAFNDGTTASGSFLFDADSSAYSDIAITTSTGNFFDTLVPGFNFNARGFLAIVASSPPSASQTVPSGSRTETRISNQYASSCDLSSRCSFDPPLRS